MVFLQKSCIQFFDCANNHAGQKYFIKKGIKMSMKRNVMLLLSGIVSSVSLMATEVTTAKIIGRTFFSLCFPFFVIPATFEKLSLVNVIILAFFIAIECCAICRMLQKSCIFVVPRMIFINVVELLVQVLVWAPLTMVMWVVYIVKYGTSLMGNMETFANFGAMIKNDPAMFDQFVLWPLAVFGLISALVLFCVRYKTACKMFAWFDPSIDRVRLSKTMLVANGLSYLFLMITMHVSMIKMLKPYLG